MVNREQMGQKSKESILIVAENPQMRTKIVYFVQHVILSNTLYKTIGGGKSGLLTTADKVVYS